MRWLPKARPARRSPPNSACRGGCCQLAPRLWRVVTLTLPKATTSPARAELPPKWLLAEAELEKDALREVAKENPSPAAKRRAVDMLTTTFEKDMSERLA